VGYMELELRSGSYITEERSRAVYDKIEKTTSFKVSEHVAYLPVAYTQNEAVFEFPGQY
jgi:hypothetical protein